jgi:hypothetical protein
MNEMDERFWTGFLKGVMTSEFEAWHTDAEGPEQWEMKKAILETLQVLERRVKLLHTEDTLVFLNTYKPDKDQNLSWSDRSDHKDLKMKLSISTID